MANQPNAQPWWHRTDKQTLDDRVKAVQNVNDPTITSDEVQRWSKIALLALLGFTTLLSGFSYFKFFETSFGRYLSIVMAVVFACIIEFGENWGFLKELRTPFFQGGNFTLAEVSNTVMWVFLLLLSVVTFSASVYNSTQGAHQLSLLLSHERTYSAFTPNTADIDAQIAKITQSDAQLGDLKRKNGKTNWAIQPVKAENAKTLASLQEQRNATITQQRADWEKLDGKNEQQNNFSANSLLAVGGWVELLQIILMFVRVAAERSLDKTAKERRTTTPPPHRQPNGQPNPVNNESAQRFYFTRSSPTGDVEAAPTAELTQQPHTVSQFSQTVTQQNAAPSANQADAVLKLAEKELRGWVANFGRASGKDSTVSGNINRILTQTANAVREKGFQPSHLVWLKFYTYLQGDLFPTLRKLGWPYEFERQLTADVYRLKPEQQEA